MKDKGNPPEIGISEIGITIPPWFIKVEKIARKRKLPIDYVNGGLGLREARIPYEVSLEELALGALNKINYRGVERFILATESDYDFSKPRLAIKILNQKLGLSLAPLQVKFACLGGIQALLLACEYSAAHNKPAVVVIADRSLYQDKKAEVTQGSGAVALRIERRPRLLSLDFKRIGQYGEDIEDFRVPAGTAPFPKVNGPLTKPAFIKCVLSAFRNYKSQFSDTGNLLREIDFLVMHTPFPKMVVWTAAALWHYENYGEGNFSTLLKKSLDNPELFKKFKEQLDKARKKVDFRNFLSQKVTPGLKYNPHVGNCYNASIFLSLIAVLEQTKENQKILISGYGSGAGSLVVMGRVEGVRFQSDLGEQIKNGKELTVSQYRDWKEKEGNQTDQGLL